MRVLGWFSKLVLSIALISFLSVFTTAYIVDLYINKFLKQWNVADMVKPDIDAEDYMSKLINPSQLLNPDDSESEEADGVPVFNQESMNDLKEEDIQQSDSATELNGELGLSQPIEKINPIEGQFNTGAGQSTPSPTQSSPGELKDTLVMSAQEFNEKRKKLTNKDKSAIFSIVITKFPQKELQRMSLILEDGITEEELDDLEEVMNAYLEQEEVTKLLAILNKY